MNNNNQYADLILEGIKKYIKEKDITNNTSSVISDEKLIEYLLQSIDASKDIQTSLYIQNEKQGGIIRKIKNYIIKKVSNITRNVVEISIIKQQRFNEGLTGIMAYLIKENRELKKQIEELKNARK